MRDSTYNRPIIYTIGYIYVRAILIDLHIIRTKTLSLGLGLLINVIFAF